MNIVEELAKLQQLKLDGALTEAEFALAKQKLLEADAPGTTPTEPPIIKVSLKEGLDEIVNEDSTLGGAANRYVQYRYTSMIVGAIVFIVFAIIMAVIFSNMQHSFNSFPGSPFQGSPFGH